MYSGMASRGYRHCFNCNCEIKEIGNNKNMQYAADGKKHFTCAKCVATMEAVVEHPQGITVRQCACGNMATSDSMIDGLCTPCQREKETITNAAPFQVHDVVKFIPMYAQEFLCKGHTHGLILNCVNYGSPSQSNWTVDLQFLKSEYEELQLTTVRAYMVAAWQIEKVDRSWVR